MAGKKIKGRKRHIAVDVLGFLICVIVHSAGQSDRAGAKPLIEKALSICSTIKIFWADKHTHLSVGGT
ncbi:transposase [Candidatus Neptunichlamydia sp. REUL1]|uniref:transposase n=1 Tax=Candidatus Neptunichlamydia sp. REUL1 TaxID=3064277 RepID=UPI00403D9AC6